VRESVRESVRALCVRVGVILLQSRYLGLGVHACLFVSIYVCVGVCVCASASSHVNQ